jgi:hypothetical protein
MITVKKILHPYFKFKHISLLLFIILPGCDRKMPEYTEAFKAAELEPDYTSISIPPNIAPLNFRIVDKADFYLARFYNDEGTEFIISSRKGEIKIPDRKWEKLLETSGSGEYRIDILARHSGKYTKYQAITNYIAQEPIDKYLVYRLIEPGFETWNEMGIYQRDLENYRQTPIMLNSLSGGNCMNCHTFSRNSGKDIMLHMRGENAGTIIFKDGEYSKVNTKTDNTISVGVYPSWHPSGDFIAYSVNNIVQSFPAIPGKKIEVYDTLSDVVVYDIKKNLMITTDLLSRPEVLETYPSWGPDGRSLYYCSAVKQPIGNYEEIRYDLMKIPFDPDNCSFGDPEIVKKVSDIGKSISFSRVSPDNKYLLFCLSDYGNFTLWHPESDIYMLDLSTGEETLLPINSDRAESFHGWSSNGRWVVFSSRRDDGLYTRPYFSYFDPSGKMHKPFILPQKDPGFYTDFMKSFNIPELITSKVELNPRRLEKFGKQNQIIQPGFVTD